MRCRIAPQLVGDQPPGLVSLTFQQLSEEAFSRTPIAARLDEDVDHVAVLVNRTPEIVLLTPDVHEEFIQVPRQSRTQLDNTYELVDAPNAGVTAILPVDIFTGGLRRNR